MLDVLEKKIPSLLNLSDKEVLSAKKFDSILEKAVSRAIGSEKKGEYVQGLTLEETALLLSIDPIKNPEYFQKILETALYVKQKIYGNRIVIFAPLYVSNYCSGSCLYCGFREENKAIERKKLSDDEIIEEVQILLKQGHKRILMLMGEHSNYSFDDFLKAVDLVSSVKNEPGGEVRRINVEIPSLTRDEFRKLKATNKIGTYTLFQETYHKPTYLRFHPHGPKSDYLWRLGTMDRALEEDMGDVGIGALFGLYDYRYEVLSLLAHAQHLDQKFNIGPHTISVPRLQKALNTPFAEKSPFLVDDLNFKKLVAIIRLAVPYTGIILSTREPPHIRREVYHLGVSQISAGSKTSPGGYNKTSESSSQFSLCDNRPVDEVIFELIDLGFIPSWCTACYRLKRTGEAFMKIAKKGEIHNFCHPNAILTFLEYLIDYASHKTKEIGIKLIEKEIDGFKSPLLKSKLLNKLEKIKNGKRDLFF